MEQEDDFDVQRPGADSGATLPAGSYVFKLADIPGNRHVVQVFDKDEKKIYTTMLAMPNQRIDADRQTGRTLLGARQRIAQAVKVWFYPGDTIGNEFVYPKSQAMRIAKETHTTVLATNDEPKASANAPGEIPVEMKTAAVGCFDENGNWQSEAERPVVMSNTPAQRPPQGAKRRPPGHAGSTSGAASTCRARRAASRCSSC